MGFCVQLVHNLDGHANRQMDIEIEQKMGGFHC